MKFFVTFAFLGVFWYACTSVSYAASWWDVQAIDTMKYSRDLSREKLFDPSFDIEIAAQMKNIASTGATHVAIATPYDKVFEPMLRRWVAAARKERLKVWFRGNWSGWEGWFGFARITRAEHIRKTKEFLAANQGLFANGDIFTACPECENGGPGDPRTTGDVAGYRKFIIMQHDLASKAFADMKKDVATNWQSMNADVARVVMDKGTTSAMGGIVAIDHYVKDPKQLARDVDAIALQSGGKVVLGEFGAPIPDLNGDMTEQQQAAWVKSALQALSLSKNLVGVSYWVNVGGSTKLWNENGSPRPVVAVLQQYFRPKIITGKVRGIWATISDAEVISSEGVAVRTDAHGDFMLPHLESPVSITITNDTESKMTKTVVSTRGGDIGTIRVSSGGFLDFLQMIIAYIL